MFDKFKDTVGNNVEAMNQLYEKFIHQIENTPLIGQYYNYKKGQNEAVLDELKGILNTILHPIDSVEGAVYALSHINETFAAVEQAISDSWNQDVVNGDWNSRAKWYGNVEMKVKLAIAELFVGTKGVDKVSTLGKTSKLSESVNFIQGTKNVITLDKFKQSVDMLNNILMPKNQFAYAGANSIHSKLDTTDFHRVEEKLSTHQFAKGEVSSSGNKGTGNTNHPVRVYRDIDDTVLNKEYEIITRKGTFVTKIVADEKLVVDMPYIGKGKQSTNSEGWLRDNKYYFNELYELHPEYFSDANIKNLNNGWAIVNDAVFRRHFPQYDIVGLKGKPLVHHHIGGGGQAMAIPQPLHPGSGGIHNIEKQIGIWGKDQENAERLQVFIK